MQTWLFMTDAPPPSSRPRMTPPSWWGRLLAAGSALVGTVLAGVLVGSFLDRHRGDHRWTLILGLVGVAVGLYLVVRAGMRP